MFCCGNAVEPYFSDQVWYKAVYTDGISPMRMGMGSKAVMRRIKCGLATFSEQYFNSVTDRRMDGPTDQQ